MHEGWQIIVVSACIEALKVLGSLVTSRNRTAKKVPSIECHPMPVTVSYRICGCSMMPHCLIRFRWI